MKIDVIAYKPGKRQGVRQRSWQLRVMCTEQYMKSYMMYEAKMNQGGVTSMMNKVGTLRPHATGPKTSMLRSEPASKFPC